MTRFKKTLISLQLLLLAAFAWPAAAQVGTVMPAPKFTATFNTGLPCNACKLYTYAAGTTTPQNTYTDNTLATPNANPVILDASGRATVFLSQTSYRFDLKTSADVVVWSVDGVSSLTPLSDVAITGTAGQTLAAGDVVFLSDGQGSLTASRWYKADATNAYSSSSATIIGMVPTAITSGTSGTIRVGGHALMPSASLTPGSAYYISSTPGALTTTAPSLARLVGQADSTTTLVLANSPVSASANTLTQAFRGLTLRTHPDADLALTTVQFSADELVMDDGTRVSTWTNKIAAITAAGENGLDTGAEAASTWYEVYGIAKADGTQAGLLHRAKDYFVSATFTTALDASQALRLATATSSDKIAQGIQVTTTGLVQFIDVTLVRTANPVGQAWFTIEADTAGNPSGTPLATSDKFDVSLLSSVSSQYLRFIFRTPVSLTAATQYHLVLQGNYAKSDANFISWGGVIAGGYASGSAKRFNGAAWSAAATAADFQFIIYTIRNDTAVTLPSGYTRKAKLGYVYNNATPDFVGFIAKGYDVRNITTRATIIGTAITSPSVAPMPTLIPPTPVKVSLNFYTTTGNRGFAGPVPDAYNAAAGNTADPPAINFITAMQDVLTNYQAIYAWTASGTATFEYYGYQWQ